MKIKKNISILLSTILLLSSVGNIETYAENNSVAFPGAEGGGMYSLGARAADNIEVYHVANLKDSGTGSFRDAVSKGNRIVVFDVAGTVKLEKILSIKNIDNITILGQTAPGEGICIGGESVLFSECDNVILRYLRIRPGDTCYSQEDGLGVRKCTNFIVDHCSVSWSVDECLSAYENKNFTAQYCIISESLNYSNHSKGAHGYGGIWGGINASFHHNLISSHKSRMPRIGTSATVHSYNDTPDYESLVDIRNNVFYNWRDEAGYGGENGVRVNIVNNYYKPSSIAKHIRFYDVWQGSKKSGTTIHVDGNIMEGHDNISQNNWLGVTNINYGTKCESIADGFTDDKETLWPNDQYINDFPVNTQTVEEAYKTVLEKVGASYYRDDTDQRIVNDVINGTMQTGHTSGYGLIDSPEDVGGYSPLHGAKKADTDNDGIPDEWEQVNGLDPNTFDSTNIAENGYTNLENYANEIIKGKADKYDVDFEELKALIKNAENADPMFFSSKDWETLQEKLTQVKNIYNLTAPTQAQVDNAAAVLKAALGTLIMSDEAYLKAAIEKAELTDTIPYTRESVEAMNNAVEAGKKALADKDEENYKALADNIYSAIKNLKYGTKKALLDEIDRIKSMDISHLTEDSQNRINTALDNAEKVYKNTEASDAEVNAALQNVVELVILGRYERKNKGAVIAVQDFENDLITNIFHTVIESDGIATAHIKGSNKTTVASNEAAKEIGWPYVCEFPYTLEHYIVSVDFKITKLEENECPLTLNTTKAASDNYLENFGNYISAFDDWGTLSIEVNKAKGTIRYFINDMPIDEERISSPNYNKAYIIGFGSGDVVYYDNFTLTALDNERFVIGDADADGVLTASDSAMVLQKVLVSTFTLPIEKETDNYLYYIDTDADGVITASDSAMILQKVLVSTYKMPAELITTTETTTESTTETTTETTTEETTETTTGDTYYPYTTPNGTIFVDIINGMIVDCADDYTGGTLPEEVNDVRLNYIGENAFENSNVEEIIIPKDYKYVYSRAFSNSKKLKKVVFANSTSINIYNAAFENCTALTDVTLPPSLKRMQNTFKGCTSLEKLVIPTNTQVFSGTIAEPYCVLYISNPQAEFYAQQYGYEYVYLTTD